MQLPSCVALILAADEDLQPAANGQVGSGSLDEDSDLGDLRDDFSSLDGSEAEGDAGGGGSGGELWSLDDEDAAAAGGLGAADDSDEGSEGSDGSDDDDDLLAGAEFYGSDMEADDDDELEEALLPSEKKAAQLDRKR